MGFSQEFYKIILVFLLVIEELMEILDTRIVSRHSG